MPVRTALALINQTLDETLAEQEGEFDAGHALGRDVVQPVRLRGRPLRHGGNPRHCAQHERRRIGDGRHRVLPGREGAPAHGGRTRTAGRRLERPAHDNLEATHQLVRALDTRGEEGTAEAIALLGGERAELARDLSYRLFTICERHKWAREALAYNALVQAWSEASRLAISKPPGENFTQREMLYFPMRRYRRHSTPPPVKSISHETILGQKGMNLAEGVVLNMGFVWNPIHIESGIDAVIEIRDPATGETGNKIVQVQVKAVSKFTAEGDDAFSFSCERAHIGYWLGGDGAGHPGGLPPGDRRNLLEGPAIVFLAARECGSQHGALLEEGRRV